MTIEEAIKTIKKELDNGPYNKRYHAFKLGIEALKRFRNLRDAGHYVGMPLLKGEKEKKGGTNAQT